MSLFAEYQEYLQNNPEGYWFKRKLYGIGWTPAKPAGWIVTGVYTLSIVGLVLCTQNNTLFWVDKQNQFVWLLGGLTVLFIVVVWKTGEPLKWQWGNKHEESD